MRRWLPFPLLWLALVALWLLLNQTLWIGHVLLGGALAFAACLAFARLQAPAAGARRPSGAWRRAAAAMELFALVAVDIVRSNIAVGRIVLHRGTRGSTAGFLEIPLTVRDPRALAALACIVTATPGTAWAGYEGGVLTLHVLDLIDEAAWTRTIKHRYEHRLMEIFE